MQEILVRLLLFGFVTDLVSKMPRLHIGIVQLSVAGRNFLTVDRQLVDVGEEGIFPVFARQRNHHRRYVRHEGRIDQRRLDQPLVNINQLLGRR